MSDKRTDPGVGRCTVVLLAGRGWQPDAKGGNFGKTLEKTNFWAYPCFTRRQEQVGVAED